MLDHLSAVILLSVAFIDSPKLWPGVSVAATSSKLEKNIRSAKRYTLSWVSYAEKQKAWWPWKRGSRAKHTNWNASAHLLRPERLKVSMQRWTLWGNMWTEFRYYHVLNSDLQAVAMFWAGAPLYHVIQAYHVLSRCRFPRTELLLFLQSSTSVQCNRNPWKEENEAKGAPA